MKKILTLFIAICMLISAIPMAVSAETINPEPTTPPASTIPEAPTAPDGTYTVDVSSTGTYKTLIEAYNAAVAEKGATSTDPIAIRVLNNISMTTTTDFSDYSGIVYIYGKANGNTYPTINGTKSAANFIILGANTVFYNINFDNGTQSFVLEAAFHEITIGNNFDGGTKCLMTGSVWAWDSTNVKYDNVHKDTNNKPINGARINVYSGTFVDIYATWRQTGCELNNESVVNIYGATVIVEELYECDTNAKSYIKATVSVNIFAGTVKVITKTSGYVVLNTALGSTVNENNPNNNKSRNYIIADEAFYVGVQNTAVSNDSKYSVRFVGVVNSLDYESVGFKISCGDKNFDTECNRAYKSIVGGENDYTAAQLGGEYIFAAAIKDIPTSAGELTFTVMPYVVVGETTYYGAAYTVTYNAVAYVSSAVAN